MKTYAVRSLSSDRWLGVKGKTRVSARQGSARSHGPWFPNPGPAFIRARCAVEAEARRRKHPIVAWRDGRVIHECPECPADDYAGTRCSVCGGERVVAK